MILIDICIYPKHYAKPFEQFLQSLASDLNNSSMARLHIYKLHSDSPLLKKIEVKLVITFVK